MTGSHVLDCVLLLIAAVQRMTGLICAELCNAYVWDVGWLGFVGNLVRLMNLLSWLEVEEAEWTGAESS